MIYLFEALILIVALAAASSAQVASKTSEANARATVLKFVELNNQKMLQTQEARALLGGEAAEDWKMDWFGQLFGEPDKIVLVNNDLSVARLQTVGKNERVVDLYFYLRLENDGWKIRSLRALAQTGFTEAVIETLKEKSDLTAQEKDDLANAGLVLSSDKTLAEWFQKNRAALDRLVALAIAETKPKPVKTNASKIKKGRQTKNGKSAVVTIEPFVIKETRGDEERDEPRTIERIGASEAQKFPKSAAVLQSLHLAAAEIKSDGSVEITIGGITDNTVGFVFSPTEKPPQIDGWRYIWIEKVAPFWYLFRTT